MKIKYTHIHKEMLSFTTSVVLQWEMCYLIWWYWIEWEQKGNNSSGKNEWMSQTNLCTDLKQTHSKASIEDETWRKVRREERKDRTQREGEGEGGWGRGDFSPSVFSRIQSAGQGLKPRHGRRRQQPFFLIRGSALLLLLRDVQHILHTTHLLAPALYAD